MSHNQNCETVVTFSSALIPGLTERVPGSAVLGLHKTAGHRDTLFLLFGSLHATTSVIERSTKTRWQLQEGTHSPPALTNLDELEAGPRTRFCDTPARSRQARPTRTSKQYYCTTEWNDKFGHPLGAPTKPKRKSIVYLPRIACSALIISCCTCQKHPFPQSALRGRRETRKQEPANKGKVESAQQSAWKGQRW